MLFAVGEVWATLIPAPFRLPSIRAVPPTPGASAVLVPSVYLFPGFVYSGMVDEVLAANQCAAFADPVAAVFTGVGGFSDCVADGADVAVCVGHFVLLQTLVLTRP